MNTGIELIAAERARQITEEGWTADHDDTEHPAGQLAGAAACYALWHSVYLHSGVLWRFIMALWPWSHEWWKPTQPADPIRDLAKAGALIAAEIDRLQRRQADAPRIILPK